jgi:hypothetical protein
VNSRVSQAPAGSSFYKSHTPLINAAVANANAYN